MSSRASQPEPVACSIGDNSATRREFLTRIRGTVAVTLASTAVTSGSPAKADQGLLDSVDGGSVDRVFDSYQNRVKAARAETGIPVPRQITNGDERKYPNFIGNFSKGLQHNNLGEVDRNGYLSLLSAVREGNWEAFEQVMLGGRAPLVNPLAGLAFDLEGTDSHQLAIPAFPSLASQDLADQAVELYWMALCRDVNFLDYETNELAQAAADELTGLAAFRGPRVKGRVTPQTLFRGFTKEDVIGPYVSQFLLKPFAYGPYAMNGTMSMYVPGLDYMTDQTSWLTVQNGVGSFGSNEFQTLSRYTCTGRDLTVYVHADPNAGLLISVVSHGVV
jgi:hypothetical protein